MFINIVGESWNVEREIECDDPRPSTQRCRLFRLQNVTFTNNVAEFGAGGLFVTRPQRILIGCDVSTIEDWENILTAWENNDLYDQHCFAAENNTVRVS